MKKIIVKTSVHPEVLNAYNSVMKRAEEEPYMIEPGYLHDGADNVIGGEAYDFGSRRYADEFVVSYDFLLDEIEWNLFEKQASIMQDEVYDGRMTPQKRAGTLRLYRRLCNEFKLVHEKYGSVDPWEIAKIEIDD